VSEIEHEHITKEMLERYFDTTQTGVVVSSRERRGISV